MRCTISVFFAAAMAMSASCDTAFLGKSHTASTIPAVTDAFKQGLDIEKQPEATMQVVNPLDDYMHVFFQLDNRKGDSTWTRNDIGSTDGAVISEDPINWGKEDILAWAPLGTKLAQEAVIPPGGVIVVNLPELDPPQFIMMAVKMTDPQMKDFLKPVKAGEPDWGDGVPKAVIPNQQSVLIEGGKDVVADASAVDGVNYAMDYELTARDDNSGGFKIVNTSVGRGDGKGDPRLNSPCSSLDEEYLVTYEDPDTHKTVNAGCRNPAKIQCADFESPQDGTNPRDSCDCLENSQSCKFNSCSFELFDIPQDLLKYKDTYDGGNENGAPVKTFINEGKHLKAGSPLANFCAGANGIGDFTTYCYDYNDLHSSPWLVTPYKLKVVYWELQ
jgi:hypothetical protein